MLPAETGGRDTGPGILARGKKWKRVRWKYVEPRDEMSTRARGTLGYALRLESTPLLSPLHKNESLTKKQRSKMQSFAPLPKPAYIFLDSFIIVAQIYHDTCSQFQLRDRHEPITLKKILFLHCGLYCRNIWNGVKHGPDLRCLRRAIWRGGDFLGSMASVKLVTCSASAGHEQTDS